MTPDDGDFYIVLLALGFALVVAFGQLLENVFHMGRSVDNSPEQKRFAGQVVAGLFVILPIAASMALLVKSMQ